jgi:hypothetical protein
VKINSYGDLKVEATIPQDKQKPFRKKYDKLTSAIKCKIKKEKQTIERKFEKWLCEFAKNANEGIVIDLPKFD